MGVPDSFGYGRVGCCVVCEGKEEQERKMKIEEQVVSLELAKKLKELEVKQDSVWYWVLSDGYFDYRLVHKGFNLDLSSIIKSIYSAFTVAELGEMLPDGSYSQRRMRREEGSNQESPLTLLWICAHKYDAKRAKTEADARASMLIYLIENKLLEERIEEKAN